MRRVSKPRRTYRILMVDDDSAFETLVRGFLQSTQRHLFEVEWVSTCGRGLDELRAHANYDLALVEYKLDPQDGLHFIEAARALRPFLPIVMLTGHGSEMVAAEALKKGAADYLPKRLISRVRLMEVVATAIKKARHQQKMAQSSERIQLLTILDDLTKLYRRHYIFDRIEKEIAYARRHHCGLSLAMLDLDHFKKVNDTYGHPVGDRVLVHVASLIPRELREIDLVGRYGGEEFLIMFPRSMLAEAFKACERVCNRVASTPVVLEEGGQLTVTCSIGVAGLSSSLRDLPALLKQADAALYDAKHAGRNRVCA